ncbi:MAG: hypothetical protein IJ088_03585 [Clostridia bacterium]|nr:hypothetical protein [Clostridia bacterium]
MILITFLLLAGMLSSALAEAVDPIRVSSQSDPQSVIAEQDVAITIKIYNSVNVDMQDAITLFDPDGVSVQKYNGLGGEQAVTYTGNWHVTSEQIANQKIIYYIRYTVDGKEITKTIPVLIQTETPAPQLIASYVISPVSARQGQQMNIAYTLANTGNIELRDITINNPGISDKTLTASSLSVNERIVLEDVFQMGAAEMDCAPLITYRAANSDRRLTVPDMTRRTLTPAQDGLELTISAENTENLYPGESIDLTAKLKNTGNSAFLGLAVTLMDGTEVASGIELAPGASYEASIPYAPRQSGNIVATVSGIDAEGDRITIQSDPLGVVMQDASMALVLNVMAAAETNRIYSEPAVVRFLVRVVNMGDTDATTLTITEAGTPVATIPSLPSGETRDVVFDLETSIAGQIQFVVTGKDAAGNDKSYDSNIIQLTYVEPTPVPTQTPPPTPVPPTPSPVPSPTPVPSVLEQAADMFSLPVLIGIGVGLVVLILAITIPSAIRSGRKKKRLADAIDTIRLSPDTRDPLKKAKAGKQKAGGKGDKDMGLGNRDIVPSKELTEEDLSREATSPAEGDGTENEPGRRRSARNEEKKADPTLRVEPVEKRPEFPETRKVDKSKTKVFSREGARDVMTEATRKVPVVVPEDEAGQKGRPSPDRNQPNKGQSDDGKPKEKKRGLFGKRKKDSDIEDEDLFE